MPPLVRSPLVLFALFAAVSLLTRWLSLAVDVLDVDEAAHAVGSWELMRGKVLYADFVNNKPPLLYVYYALAQAAFGRGLIAVHLATALLTVPATALAASAFFGHGRRGLIAGLLYLVYGASFLAHDMLASNTEILLLLPSAWAVVLVKDEVRARSGGRLAAAGALLGIAFLLKYQAVAWLPALGLAAAVAPPRPGWTARAGRLALLAAGFAAPLAATYLWFRAQGAAHALVYWTLWNNARYTANPISLEEAAGRAAASVLPFLVVTAPLWWAARRSRGMLSRHERLLLGGLLAGAAVAVFWGLRFFPHYLVQLYWPLAVAAAPAVETSLLRGRKGRLFLAWTAAMLLGFTAANAYLYLGGSRVYRERDPVFRRVAERLSRDVCYPGGSLFVWGYAPMFYYYSGLAPASRFVVLPQSRLTGYVSGNLGAGRDRDAIVPEHWDWLMADLDRSQATYILDTEPAGIFRWDRYPVRDFPRLLAYLDGNYELIDEVDRVRIHRRRGCAGFRPEP
jgi:4-amino-4-deoxy-L-arabinose transferase-like glycosyltransferase